MRQRATAILVKDSKILLVKIADKGRSWWCPPGGTIRPDETPEDAAVRELQEELNLEVVPSRRLYVVPMQHEEGIEFGILVEAASTKAALGIDQAVVDWTWRSLDDVDDLPHARELKAALASDLNDAV